MNTYLSIIDYGKPGLEGIYKPEDTKRDIIARIISGEDKPVKVFELCESDEPGRSGTLANITEDIAREVQAQLVEIREPISLDMQNWLDEHLRSGAVQWLYPRAADTPLYWTQEAAE